LIEQAYMLGASLGLAVWTQDEAGPFQCKPVVGQQWHEPGQPQRQSHDYLRQGTAKLTGLFHPATGEVRAKGVWQCTTAVLPPWLKAEFTASWRLYGPPPRGSVHCRVRCGRAGKKDYSVTSPSRRSCRRCDC